MTEFSGEPHVMGYSNFVLFLDLIQLMIQSLIFSSFLFIYGILILSVYLFFTLEKSQIIINIKLFSPWNSDQRD